MALILTGEFNNVGAVIEVPNRGFLFQLRDNIPDIVMPGRWGLFGGHIESGESAEETLIREVKEEICYLPSNFNLLTELVYSRPDCNGRKMWLKRTFYYLQIPESDRLR